MDAVTRAAIAMRDAASEFAAPVGLYVEPEAAKRWEADHPDSDAYLDQPDRDWALESWKILARAALEK